MELSRRARLVGTGLGFTSLWLASPGVLRPDGIALLAVLAMALWARYASRPGRWSFAIEVLTGALAWTGLTWWASYVWPGTMLIMGPGHGVYMATTGWALRRFARRFPLALAAPLAWMLLETIRAQLMPPFGLPWMRLGTFFHDQGWIAGSARVWGTGGLGFVVAALGGLLADLAERVRPLGKSNGKGSLVPQLVAGLGPLALGLVFALACAAPKSEPGPRVLLVQPAFEQKRKQDPLSGTAMMREQLQLTVDGLAEAARAGEPTPDLVCWGETMMRVPIADPELEAAVREGADFDPWRKDARWSTRELPQDAAAERGFVQDWLFGHGRPAGAGILPPGTCFASGAEYMTPIDGRIRFKNAVFLWPGPGQERRGPASKRHLVPGAETMLGLERFESVRRIIYELAKYVPDMVAAEDDDPVLAFTARDGRTFRTSVAVCFDNAFDDVFTQPAREADVDFHLVVSNEAWFERSLEADQMIAFSRLAAIATGRSVVRATNSGISCVIAPDGSEVARLRVGGEDRQVRGTLRATVPVPAGGAHSPFDAVEGDSRSSTPFVRWQLAWIALWTAAPALFLALGTRRRAK